MRLSIKRKKKKGSIFISSVLTLLLVGIIAGSIFAINSNIISLSNSQKENTYIQNTLLSEINYYSSLKIDKVVDKDYSVKNNNTDVKVSTKVLNKTNNYVELEIKVFTDKKSTSKTIKLIK